MSDKHFAFIFASYAVTIAVIGGLILWSILDYRRLSAALEKLPARPEDPDSDAAQKRSAAKEGAT